VKELIISSIISILITISTTAKPTDAATATAKPTTTATPLPEATQKLVTLIRTTAQKYRHLPYKFGGDEPKDGGFDCSGATSYLLKKIGLKPPRTSAQQFIWVRDHSVIHRVGKSVTSLQDPSLKHLKIGDLLFWSGTYKPTDGRKIKITHVAIYLGKEADGHPIMACSTSGRRYRGKRGNGFGIYDFKLPSKSSKATFVGYGTPPNLNNSSKSNSH